eukprot:8226933-Pyramimonas_sp.AAC.1
MFGRVAVGALCRDRGTQKSQTHVACCVHSRVADVTVTPDGDCNGVPCACAGAARDADPGAVRRGEARGAEQAGLRGGRGVPPHRRAGGGEAPEGRRGGRAAHHQVGLVQLD